MKNRKNRAGVMKAIEKKMKKMPCYLMMPVKKRQLMVKSMARLVYEDKTKKL